MCITRLAYCDGYVDCPDSSDEANCAVTQGKMSTRLFTFSCSWLTSRLFLFLHHSIWDIIGYVEHDQSVKWISSGARMAFAFPSRSSATDSRIAWTAVMRKTAVRAVTELSSKNENLTNCWSHVSESLFSTFF